MELSAAVLALLLVSQAAQAQRQPAAPSARPTPIELTARAVRLPADASGRFQAIGLADVFQDAPREPRQRLAAVQSYWRLWRAFAHRAIAERQVARLKQIIQQVPAGVEATLVTAELATSQAQLAEADLAIREAQSSLCTVLGWNASGSMPRPSDPPHVETYNTRYETTYGRRAANDRALLIHQTLPIYHAALGAHGTARQAADDMVAAQEASFQRGEINIETLLAAWQAQSRQQRELCRLTLLYNELIAEYAVPFPRQDRTPSELVGMLIRTEASTASRPNPRAAIPNRYDNSVEPAEFTQDAPAPADLAPGDIENGATESPQSWPANLGAEEQLDGDDPGARDPFPDANEYEGTDPNGDQQGAEPDDATNSAPEDPFTRGDESARYERNTLRRFAAKAVVDNAATPVFAGLTAANVTPRVAIEKMLARTYIGDQGETRLPLSKCLAAVSATRYAELLDAYVEAWRAASNYQADADSLAQIKAAEDALLQRLDDQNAAQDMLVLRAAETMYWARMIEDEAEIWRGMKVLGAMVLPRQPNAKALPVDEPPVWAAAPDSPAAPALLAKARGLLAVDAARAQANLETASTAGLTGLTLQAIERQNEETRGFIVQTAHAAQVHGGAVLASSGPTVTASALHRALLGAAAANAARPASAPIYRP